MELILIKNLIKKVIPRWNTKEVKMTKSSTVNLFNAVDKLFDAISPYTTTTDSTTYPVGHYQYQEYTNPFIYIDRDFNNFWNSINIPIIDTPSYPPANGWFLSDGTLMLEIAVTGFDKDELSIKRDDYNLIIKGDPIKKESNDRKELFHTLARRKFTLKYSIPSKMDLDKIDVNMDKGILTIKVPIKEEMRPIVKEIEIQ